MNNFLKLRVCPLSAYTTHARPYNPFAQLASRLPLRKHFKSRFPAANVTWVNEVVATIAYFSDTPALDDGIMGPGVQR
jgi:hypothetical protein